MINFLSSRILRSVFLFVLLTTYLLVFTVCVCAQISGPGWITAESGPAGHEDAQAYYKSLKSSGPGPFKAPKSPSTATSPEIRELARALLNEPGLIYDYVHNHIDYVPYYGVLKGATGTYLDSRGNDFDQACLMVALLRESGYEADFVFGRMTIPGDKLANWLGVDRDPNAIGAVIASGGIPVDALYSNGDCEFDRVWVRATIGQATIDLDPAFKQYDYSEKIDLAQATGYDMDDLLDEARSGSSIGLYYVRNLNEIGISGKITEYSNNLLCAIRNNHPNSSVEEIVGGRAVVQSTLEQYPSSLPFSPAVVDVWNEPIESMIATLTIRHEGIDHSFFIPEIAGKRLTVTYAAGIPQLRLDGGLIATGNTTTQGDKYDLSLAVDHPYAANNGHYADQESTYRVESGGSYAIVSDFGGISDSAIAKRRNLLDSFIAQALPESSEEVRGETLNIMGLNWLREVHCANRMVSELAETTAINHHRVGLMAQETGYYIDVKTSLGSYLSRHGTDADKLAHFNAMALVASAMEHGVLEQLAGPDNPAASTMKLFQTANARGDKLFSVDSGNFSSIKTLLVNYSDADLNSFQSMANAGYSLILPQDGKLPVGQWEGKAYVSRYSRGGAMSVGMVIGGGYMGGYGGYPGDVEPDTVNDFLYLQTPDLSRTDIAYDNPLSDEPVDMSSGAYLYRRTDLALGGDATFGLAFTRSYNSSANYRERGLGYGWTHNYDIYLKRSSNAFPSLGKRQPADAAALVSAFFAALDLMKNQDTLLGWTTASLIAKIAMDQLVDNSVTVHLNDDVAEFVKLSDGTWSPPPGVASKLVGKRRRHFQYRGALRHDGRFQRRRPHLPSDGRRRQRSRIRLQPIEHRGRGRLRPHDNPAPSERQDRFGFRLRRKIDILCLQRQGRADDLPGPGIQALGLSIRRPGPSAPDDGA